MSTITKDTTPPTLETIYITLVDHIATVVLNRPDRANAMNWPMWQEILQPSMGGQHA